MTTIAFIGLGAMGRRMAANLLKAGHLLRVHNRTAAAMEPLVALGALACASPRDAAAGAEVVISMVRDDEASKQVWAFPGTGVLGAAQPGQVFIECSTLSPAWVRELGGQARAAGVAFLDAPVLGSLAPAEAGQLIFVVGGEAAVLDPVRPLLGAMGAAIHGLGPTGSGAAFKLAVNALLGIQTAALGELVGLLVHGGLDRDTVFRVLPDLPVMSPAAKGFLTLIGAEDHAPRFTVDLIRKDLWYAEDAARAAGTALPLTHAAAEAFGKAQAAGLGAANLTAIAQLYR
ncbi:MAG TPA: NAD(P)-dependent oxidoreductase [Holophagaceae bacterium]|nr:NAD(P)-dependent oxidoreductase [Holophagaceae bacterium]